MDNLSFDMEVVTQWLAERGMTGALTPDVLKSLTVFSANLGQTPASMKPPDVTMLEKVVLALVTVFVTAQSKKLLLLSNEVQSQFAQLGLVPEPGTSGEDVDGEKPAPVVASPETLEP